MGIKSQHIAENQRELQVPTAVALSLTVGEFVKIKATDGYGVIGKAELDD